ncbi:MAG: TIGR01244 family sulfur transferase [Brevundimonas sp.]|uniref:TIGR01244 family sulfur transferase n=1 Tax=Brevundimonas sp. TaxID=1871086 RepID=UPI002734D859|nr:TIGR01244 family sulfur transferase [Brevundimonas sp.]MDP3376728.1 TIGR01244 family sulfur transferase [Brevundimonas sp.]
MTGRKLDDTLSTSPQVTPDELEIVAAAGFRAVISNRPDGEDPGQPTAAEMKAAAENHGLAFRHIPVTGGGIGPSDIQAMAEALDTLPGPIFGFCRTGTRTAMLWALAKAPSSDPDTLIAAARDAGYDLSGLRSRL